MDSIKPCDLQVGDVYYECESGFNIEATVITPVSTEITKDCIIEGDKPRKQWRWTSKDDSGREFNCLVTEGLEHYCGKLYSRPQYISRVDGVMGFFTTSGKLIEKLNFGEL